MQKCGSSKQWAEMKDRNEFMMDEARHVLSLSVSLKNLKDHRRLKKKKLTFFLYFLPVRQKWINTDPMDESRCIFCYACHSDTIPTVEGDMLSVWVLFEKASDWQTGELEARGSSNDDLSPTTHYTSRTTGSSDGVDAGSPGLFSSSVPERCRQTHSGSGCTSQTSWRVSF